MKPRATHLGECQMCGRVQKLPGGLMAKHGYQVESGFFNGTCQGSSQQPFELSCELSKTARADMESRANELVVTSSDLKAGKLHENNQAWFQIFAFQRYWWYLVTVVQTSSMDDQVRTFGYMHGTSEGEQIKPLNMYAQDLDSLRKQLNAQYARHLDGQIAEMQGYIQWQTERIKGWSTKPLSPIPEEPASAPTPKRQNRLRRHVH